MRLLSAAIAAALLSGCLSYHHGAIPGEPPDDFIELRGTRVRYVDQGQGPPVLLIHGFASAIEAWDTVIPELESDHRVIALDLKGFGWSDRPEGDYSIREQAAIALELLDELGVGEVAVVGHSFGAAVSLALAHEAPQRVTSLVLYDAWVYDDQLPNFFHWARAEAVGETLFALFYLERIDERLGLAFFDPAVITETLVEDVEAAMDRPGTRAAALASVRAMNLDTFERTYGDIDVPALLLWGREDRVSAIEYGERLLRDLPQAELITFPRCGHLPMIEAAAESNTALLDFLGEHHGEVRQ